MGCLVETLMEAHRNISDGCSSDGLAMVPGKPARLFCKHQLAFSWQIFFGVYRKLSLWILVSRTIVVKKLEVGVV